MTSTKTPSSMYMIVTETKAMKKTIKGHNPGLPLVIWLMISAFAPNTAGSSKVFNESGTVWKRACPTVLPSVSCLKRIAKAYVMMAHKREKTQTDRAANARPLTMIMSSGKDRNNLVKRVRRTNLASRISRNTEDPSGRVLEPPASSSTTGVIHVSTTMRIARQKSKLNQKSLKAWIFFWKASNRIVISTVKYEQKRFSAMIKAGCASHNTVSVFRSASTPSQIEFNITTKIVKLSKNWWRAMRCAHPSSR
mmetsp:Transcript_65831/g.155008  ORF Transcript_65831/g.155008 Transcript_65831/m.155008 type:complete len:251 (+) Transcript_65831:636-1388(+)